MSLFLWIVLVKVVYMTWISERVVDTSISVLNGKFMNILLLLFYKQQNIFRSVSLYAFYSLIYIGIGPT